MTGLNLPDQADQSENYPYALAEERYVVVRKPDAQGVVVAKFERSGEQRFPKALHDIDSFNVTYPGSKGALEAQEIDETADLTTAEKEVLEEAGFPAKLVF